MKELVLDTSSQILFVNIVIDGIVKYSVLSEGKNNHSDNLLNFVKEGLKELNLEIKDMDRIVCGYGRSASSFALRVRSALGTPR